MEVRDIAGTDNHYFIVSSGSRDHLKISREGQIISSGNLWISASVGLSAGLTTFTASLRQGYAWVGGADSMSYAAPTSSWGGGGGGSSGTAGSSGTSGAGGAGSSSGTSGSAGSSGTSGSAGSSGTRGSSGTAGSSGTSGSAGSSGTSGSAGSSGTSGAGGAGSSSGTSGSAGSSGTSGSAGSSGTSGSAGSSGTRGSSGTAGSSGTSGTSFAGSGTTTQIAYFSGTTTATSPNNTGDNRLTWDNTNSRLGVRTSSPTYPLDVSGSVKVSGSLSVGNIIPSATVGRIDAANDVVAFSTSDIRFKTNIRPILDSLDKVMNLNGVEFDWIPNPKYHGNTGNDVGVIANEVERVLPQVVTIRHDGVKAVKYEKIVPLLIEAIKEQQKEIDELKRIVKSQ
jgi:hypothetical protein